MSSGNGYFAYLCSSLEEVEDVNFNTSSYIRAFYGCNKLVSIAKINSAKGTDYSYAFNYCSELIHIRFDGVIGQNLDFKDSPLDVESIKSIVSHLYDYSAESPNIRTITFKTSAFEALEEEGATAEYNGTPCTWEELIGYKKWNLTLAS
jgi:hypothetical protein